MGKIILFLNLLCAIHFINGEVGIKSRQITPTFNENQQENHGNDTYLDAQKLYDAMTGIGTDEKVIIDILTTRSSEERQAIRYTYKEMFNKDLIDDLKSDSSGNFKSVVKALMLEPHYYLARKVRKALHKFVTDDKTVTEIICTKQRSDLALILAAYEIQFNKTLKSEINELLEGDQKTFLKLIVSDPLRKKGDINPANANEQLTYIPNANDFCTIKENGMLMEFLAKESFEQIALVEVMHRKSKNMSIIDNLKRWCTKDDLLRDSYITIVRFALDPIKFYAEELYSSVIGLGTDDDKLQRIIVGRSEIDLFNIKNKYQELYNTSLVSSVEADTSGHYEKILVRIIERSDYTGVARTNYS